MEQQIHNYGEKFQAYKDKVELPAKKGWASGEALKRCSDCHILFCGHRHATQCSNCAYELN